MAVTVCTASVLAAVPYAAPFARLGRLRSAGITDLREGNVRDEDWQGFDRFSNGLGPPEMTPLPDDVASYALAATSARQISGESSVRLGRDRRRSGAGQQRTGPTP
ncbi:hypothetical protein RM530_02605 [Algiphilus sp. W345]|uniref:Uncharacterized protein n=1 Tax=Banduia mediterranea TaxID=3075609 RepID=A0ABU2WFH6_9GAMM|nr:hypothetical protein [Algiphilus sp. W345]MDT0496258.1 hypothetical protein [Algiphilus sp. W345]